MSEKKDNNRVKIMQGLEKLVAWTILNGLLYYYSMSI